MECVNDHLFKNKRPPDQNRLFQQIGDCLTEHGCLSETEQKPISVVKREAEKKSGNKQQTDEGTKPWRRPNFTPTWNHVASPVMVWAFCERLPIESATDQLH